MRVLTNIKKAAIATLGLFTVGAVSLAHAQAAPAVDLKPITGAVSSGDITTGVLAIGAVMAVVWVTVKAVKIVMAFLKSA